MALETGTQRKVTGTANGPAIRAIRQAKGWKGAKLAARIGIGHAHLFNIEAGRRGASDEVLRALADTLGVPLAAITGNYDVSDVA